MKTVHIKIEEAEHLRLKSEAHSLGISLNRLVRDRVVGGKTPTLLLIEARMVTHELAAVRHTLNQILRRELECGSGLYEDSVLAMDQTMNKIESILANYVKALEGA